MMPTLLDSSELDIDYVSRLIARIVEDYVRQMERKARRSEDHGVEFMIDPRDSAELANTIRCCLRGLDQARSDNLRILRERLIEMTMLYPGPVFIGKLPGEPTT